MCSNYCPPVFKHDRELTRLSMLRPSCLGGQILGELNACNLLSVGFSLVSHIYLTQGISAKKIINDNPVFEMN